MSIISMDLGKNSYDIVIERGVLNRAAEELNLNRKVLIVSDKGVPSEYANCIASQCKDATIFVFEGGEASKTLQTVEQVLRKLLEKNFTRKDCVVAVGGGISGDLAGFAASCYMRGIDFYNIPTTVLSQVDSSIGGKTAVNLDSVKNIIGAFYQPKKVLIDPDVLKTLPTRQLNNGLAEALKMAVTFDSQLFELFATQNPYENLDLIIEKSLISKKIIVEQDEKELGIRKVLNFGHTIGHGIESSLEGKLYHGECVGLGMLPMCSNEVREKLIPCLEKLNLPTKCSFDKAKVCLAIGHDKKGSGKSISTVYVPEIGKFEFNDMTIAELEQKLSIVLGE
ncbi:MAG: 3-dehydroquinate synthase [Sphaerochaetaceae bacterium]|nr:3-dehydroquinate synthase [Sphaerochaetaceae bacterium]